MKVKIFIPVSREEHLERLFASLEVLVCNPETTSLFVYVDGPAGLFVKAQRFTEHSRFTEKLCVMRVAPKAAPRQFDINGRRRRIAAIQNEAKAYLGSCDYIFGIEDDTIVPSYALARLLADYSARPFAGFIEGVELGRWGIPYVGAWRVDDVYDPTRAETVLPPTGDGLSPQVEEVDAGGFYCYLTKTDLFLKHDHQPAADGSFGPDGAYGLALRQQGLQNYIDWSIRCEHRIRTGESLTLANTKPKKVVLTKEASHWRQEVLGA